MTSAGIVSNVLPLWRIHNLSRNGAGDTVSIVNISRPDTIALLRELSGGHGPIWAAGKLALAVNYSTEPSTVAEATLVRIKEVSASDQPGVYNAQLLVLCQARVCNVLTGGPFPTARRAPDLAPLWKIHKFGLVGDPAFDTKRNEVKIGNIAREDTLAMLKKLGGGDVKAAEGHLVLACDFEANVAAGLRAVLVRIGDVTCGEKRGPPYNCTLKILGHVRCARVYTVGTFPQALLDEMPVWRIHNLNTGSSGPEHRINNISRPDSVALLAYLGQGNPLAAAGGLVIGCDYSSPPAVGESGRLMQIASICSSTESGKYEALLVDVSTVSIGKFRTSIEQDWWPRVTVVLPKVWNKTAKSIEPLVRTPTPATSCLYWVRCQSALINLMCDAGIQLTDQRYTEKTGDRCFCLDCHRLRGDRPTYQRGSKVYALPIGFAQIGIKPSKTHGLVERGMKDWHVCYHGTKHQYLGDILIQGQLLAPGSTLHNGDSIKVRPGHITSASDRLNEHTGNKERFDPRNKVFFSPSIKYCDHEVYSNAYYCDGKMYRFVLQLRIQPDTYSIGQETIGASMDIDPHIPNKSIEWYTHQLHTHFFTGILIREQRQ